MTIFCPAQRPGCVPLLCAPLWAAATLATAQFAHAQEPTYSLAVGLAAARFNVQSGELTGPPGATPPGLTTGVNDIRTLGFEWNARMDSGWGVSLAGGAPPVIHFTGEGAAAPLGTIGSARAWFPAVLATYAGPSWGRVRPFVAAGVNYTTYSNATVYPNYSAAVQGTASSSKLKSSFGLVGKIGAEISLDNDWYCAVSWSRYGIRTTATITTDTPGVGTVVRKVKLRADPDVVGVLIGKRF